MNPENPVTENTVKDEPVKNDKCAKLITLIITVIAGICIPLAIFSASWIFAWTMKQAELEIQYTKIALGILIEEPNEPDDPLRDWAKELLDKMSPVSLPEKANEALNYRSLPKQASPTIEFPEGSAMGYNIIESGDYEFKSDDGKFGIKVLPSGMFMLVELDPNSNHKQVVP